MSEEKAVRAAADVLDFIKPKFAREPCFTVSEDILREMIAEKIRQHFPGDEQLREAANELRRKIDVMARSNSWTSRGETVVSREAYLDVIDADRKLRSALAGKEE